MRFQIHSGLCEEVMATMLENSVDSIVCDPPYGINFMGHKWDYEVPTVLQWKQCLRLLKPGGHLLAFGGSRTYHRLVVNMEDAGFEIRDQLMWIYGSGFPKSKNLNGEYEGLGTALKPAHEPIVMARKPLIGTVESNVIQFGTGALNIDVSRVGSSEDQIGRWPANVIHDGSEEVISAFPDAKGQQAAITGNEPTANGFSGPVSMGGNKARVAFPEPRIDEGKSAARFFYCAKVSKSERDEGMDRFVSASIGDMTGGRKEGSDGLNCPRAGAGRTGGAKNYHSTVKPVALMRYLCRLITPTGGVILDPWMGSGSTGKAAILDGFSFIGIEKDPESLVTAAARISHSVKIMESVDV